MVNCRICKSKTALAFTHLVMNKHNASYYSCSNCGFLFVDEPYWLHLAYSNAIAATDTGILLRNINLSKKIASILYWLFGERGRGSYVDVAGGYGLLTRLMRDYGISFFWSDKYCENKIAIGFEYPKDISEKIVSITAIEVMEHLEDPVGFIKNNFEKFNCDTLIFTTEFYSGDIPNPKSWWYYSFETGQHIGFFQEKTFRFIATQMDMNFYTYNGIHIITKKKINTTALKMVLSRVSIMAFFLVRKQLISLTIKDHLAMINRIKGD